MSTEHEDNLRDLAAMFAMVGLIMRNDGVPLENAVDQSFVLADRFMQARSLTPEPDGIAGIKRRKKKAEE